MRKIEQQMNRAISDCKDWKSDNTEVCVMNDGTSHVYLHNNKIAEIGSDYVQIFDGGHQTKTTKSRLNAILQEHGIKGECVFQRNFKWYVHRYVGQAGSSPVFVEKEFENGLILS